MCLISLCYPHLALLCSSVVLLSCCCAVRGLHIIESQPIIEDHYSAEEFILQVLLLSESQPKSFNSCHCTVTPRV